MPGEVLIVPGFLGSELVVSTPAGRGRRVWMDVPAIWHGSVSSTHLAPDGQSPGAYAQGVELRAGFALAACYHPLARYLMAGGFSPTLYGWDWRRSMTAAASDLAWKIPGLALNGPVAVVAHSAGGLVARGALKLLAAAGNADVVRVLITLGAPQFGTPFVVRCLAHFSPLYLALAGVTSLGRHTKPAAAVAVLDACLASWPGLLELLPWRDGGPLPQQGAAAAAAVYSVASYAPFHEYMTQAGLDRAAAAQDWFLDAGDLQKERAIIGYGYETWDQLLDPTNIGSWDAWSKTQAGDGTVPQSYATRPGLTTIGVPAQHFAMPIDPRIGAAVLSLL